MGAANSIHAEDVCVLGKRAHGRQQLEEKRTNLKTEVRTALDGQGISYDWDPASPSGRDKPQSDEFNLVLIDRPLLVSPPKGCYGRRDASLIR